MAKLDWSKTLQSSSDPARVQKDRVDASVLASTPAAEKEMQAAQKARQKSAKRAADLRKRNRGGFFSQKNKRSWQTEIKDEGSLFLRANPPPPADPPATS